MKDKRNEKEKLEKQKKKKDGKALSSKAKGKEKEEKDSSKKIVKKENHFASKCDIKRALLLKQSFYLLLSRESYLSTTIPCELEVIPQVKEFLDEGLVRKSLTLCALLVPKIGIMRHQIPVRGDMMNVLSGATFFCKITHASNIFMIHIHRDSLGRCKYNNPKPASTRKLQQGTPTLEYVKCNVDAAIFHDACSFGGGCCLQDSTGHFIRANTNWYQGIPTPQVAESSSLLAAISWAFEIHLQNIIFKTDCKANVDVLARKISQTQKQG
ncbi:hypothetical protein D0Y65_006623 [Glycine soja]|uniref:RNase H type-1 domain-containing protein n=1 Tax=Glycine soja TaxID=3848 RepID=A0A445LA96_GLYSO|nr:hypothetical protein D0Y65_006623 [Glycine soja]